MIDLNDEMKDTGHLQFLSVVQFMKTLGYQYVPAPEDGKAVKGKPTNVFENQHAFVKHIRYVSLQTAIRLHNLRYYPDLSAEAIESCWQWKKVRTPQGIPTGYTCAPFLDIQLSPELQLLAQASKIVKKAKLTADRHGNIIVQSQKVKFVNGDMAARFGLPRD